MRSDAAVKSIEDARKPGAPPLVLGGTGEGASGNDVAIVLRDTLGLNIKLVAGYPDSPALFMAVDRRELDGRGVGYSSLLSSKPEWLKTNSGMRVLLQFGRSTRHPDFPDVPIARELARSDAARALIELAELPYALSRPFVAPPDVPPERAKALQAAFLAVHGDPHYLEDAAKLKIDVSPIGSEEALRVIDRMITAPQGAIDALKRLLTERKGG